jgi:hypothetical protein
VSVVARKFSCPHGRSLIGAVTGSGADGCAARAELATRANCIIFLDFMALLLRSNEDC